VHGHWDSGFRAWLTGLPDRIARQAGLGMPVTFPLAALPDDPGKRASVEALMATLGVQITQAPATGLRAQRARAAAELRAEGLTAREIAERLAVSPNYAHSLLSDPDGAKDRARKDSYRKPCPNCGRLMTGSNGNGPDAPSLCRECAKPERYWTRDRIIDAVQRFARIHGRPPVVDDWRHADPDNGYPAATATYGTDNPGRPAAFACWADVIEAAGFPRPYSGTRRNRPGGRPMEHTAHTLTTSKDCKQPNCTNEARWSRGPYAGLCEEHAGARPRNGTPLPARPATRPATATGGLEGKVKELAKLGREADRTRDRAKRLAEQALQAKRHADAAQAAFQRLARELMGDA